MSRSGSQSATPGGLLGPIVYIDLVGQEEAQAKDVLLRGVQQGRAKPLVAPGFPGALARQVAEKPRFPVPLHNLPPANPDFVGREDVLARLHELLNQGQQPAVLTQAITGLGGIGKTQTALAYCYKHLSDYTLIWWLRAEQAATLAGQFVALAPPLGLDPAMPDQAALATLVRDTLAQRDGFLLVFDNLEEPEVLPAFLPRTGGTVLITARQRDWHGRAKTLALDVMTEPEALRLLTGGPDPETLPPAELAEAMALARELGYLPLALAQARDYMAATGETFAGYHALLVASRPIVLAEGHAHPDYPATVARTWDVSIRAVEKECPAARALLELLAFFGPDPLPRSVLAAAPDALPEPLRDPLARNRAIAALTRFSLVIAAQGSLTVHRLVQAVTRDGLVPDRAAARVGCAIYLAVSWWSYMGDHKGMSMGSHVLDAVDALFTHGIIAVLNKNPASLMRILSAMGIACLGLVRVQHTNVLYQRSLTIPEKTLGFDYLDLAPILKDLVKLFQGVIAILEETPSAKHLDFAPLASGLVEVFQCAIVIDEKILPPDHPHRMRRRENYAHLLDELGRPAEAAKLRAQASR